MFRSSKSKNAEEPASAPQAAAQTGQTEKSESAASAAPANGHVTPQLTQLASKEKKPGFFSRMFSRSGSDGDSKFAIGIFDEGLYLHVVCLSRRGRKINFVDAETYKLANRLEAVAAGDDFIMETTSVFDEGLSESNLSGAPSIEDPDIVITESSPGSASDEHVYFLKGILSKYTHRNYQVAISLAEPQVFYNFFHSDWGLEGEDLKVKVLEEISKSRPNLQRIKLDDIQTISLKDNRLLAIVRDSSLNILNLLENVQKGVSRKLAFIESAETSLVNLVKENYDFQAHDLSLIVYIGHEYSRLVFMRGNEIYNISNIIEAFLDSENISKTIYSRILLEQDNLGLPNPNSIIVTGEASEAQVVEYLQEKMPRGIHIDYLSFQRFGVAGMDSILSRFSVAIGAALRILHRENDYLYDVDMTPGDIKEGQKIFKLGLFGWLLLALIPVVSFLATIQIVKEERLLDNLKKQVRTSAAELTQLEDIEARLNSEQGRLANYDKGLVVLDTLSSGTSTWSDFLGHLYTTTNGVGGIWITDIKQSRNQVEVKGFSLNRDKIPEFCRGMKGSVLQSVDIQEIRNRKVYNFNIITALRQQ